MTLNIPLLKIILNLQMSALKPPKREVTPSKTPKADAWLKAQLEDLQANLKENSDTVHIAYERRRKEEEKRKGRKRKSRRREKRGKKSRRRRRERSPSSSSSSSGSSESSSESDSDTEEERDKHRERRRSKRPLEDSDTEEERGKHERRRSKRDSPEDKDKERDKHKERRRSKRDPSTEDEDSDEDNEDRDRRGKGRKSAEKSKNNEDDRQSESDEDSVKEVEASDKHDKEQPPKREREEVSKPATVAPPKPYKIPRIAPDPKPSTSRANQRETKAQREDDRDNISMVIGDKEKAEIDDMGKDEMTIRAENLSKHPPMNGRIEITACSFFNKIGGCRKDWWDDHGNKPIRDKERDRRFMIMHICETCLRIGKHAEMHSKYDLNCPFRKTLSKR